MRVLESILVCCVVLESAAASAQTVLRSVAGASGDWLGSAIANAGDTNSDGWDDYLVGTPNASGRGGVVCVSGKYLATGNAPSTLYSYVLPYMSGASGTGFGWTIASIGDANGDGVTDFIIGAPGADKIGVQDCGALYFFDGALHTAGVGLFHGSYDWSRLGSSLAATGDMDGDGIGDVIAGAPAMFTSTSAYPLAHLVSGGQLASGQNGLLKTFLSPSGAGPDSAWGYAVCGNVDFNGDGIRDVVVSAPYAKQSPNIDQGIVQVISGAPGFPTLASYWGQNNNALGRALATGADFDGDLHPELVVSAFKTDAGSSAGKVIALSVAHLIQTTPPYEIFSWNGPSQLSGNTSFGAALAIAPDINGDGHDDLLVGLPTYNLTLTSVTGAVFVYSSATGARIGAKAGAQNERIGNTLLGCVDDLDSDGFSDFLVGGWGSDVPTTDCGVLKAMRLFPAALTKYCAGKINSQGCTPSMGWSGTASASSAAAFLVKATNVLNNKNGLLFYGDAPLATAFQGGLLCVRAPTVRTTIQNSAGSASGNDCTGIFSVDFNARIQSGVDPQLVPGHEVFCQYWSRDPASPSTTSLSDALSFVVNP